VDALFTTVKMKLNRVLSTRDGQSCPSIPLLQFSLQTFLAILSLVTAYSRPFSCHYYVQGPPPYLFFHIPPLGPSLGRRWYVSPLSFSIITLPHEEPIATSNAPTIGRKRKINDEDEDMQESGSTRKRRGQLESQDTSELGELGVKGSKGGDTDPGVKEVTRGVKVVELEDKEESRADDGKGIIEEASETVDGESSVTTPLDPAHAPQNDDDPSQDVTAADDEAPASQSEVIVGASSNNPPEVDASTSTHIGGPLTQEEKEEAPSDTTPEATSEEIADVGESVEPSAER